MLNNTVHGPSPDSRRIPRASNRSPQPPFSHPLISARILRRSWFTPQDRSISRSSLRQSSLFQFSKKQLLRPMHPGPHCANRATKNGGCLLVTEFLERAENDRFAIFAWEAHNSLPNLRYLLLPRQVRDRVGRGDRWQFLVINGRDKQSVSPH